MLVALVRKEIDEALKKLHDMAHRALRIEREHTNVVATLREERGGAIKQLQCKDVELSSWIEENIALKAQLHERNASAALNATAAKAENALLKEKIKELQTTKEATIETLERQIRIAKQNTSAIPMC